MGSGERVFKVRLEVNHTIKNRFAIRVFFLLCNQENGLNFQVKWPANAKISSKEKKQILDHVLANRSALLIEWEAKVCTQGN